MGENHLWDLSIGERRCSFAFLFLGMKPQLFGFRWQNFNFQITFPIILFSPATSYPKKEGKTILPILYIGACPVKTEKGTPCSLTLTGVPKKRKRYDFFTCLVCQIWGI